MGPIAFGSIQRARFTLDNHPENQGRKKLLGPSRSQRRWCKCAVEQVLILPSILSFQGWGCIDNVFGVVSSWLASKWRALTI